MKVGLLVVIILFAGCAPSQPYRSGPGPYGGGSGSPTGGSSGMSSDTRPTSSLSQDATECERKAILAGPGNKAAAFDSCMRAKGHTTSR